VIKIAQSDGKPPKAYIKTIADLEDFMNETIAKQKVTPKKMNATNAKGLNAMKQKARKNNKDYATEIEKYRADKFEYMMSDDEEEAAPAPKKASKSAPFIQEGEATDEQGFSVVGRQGRTLQYTPESILSHLRIINESRGKKNTDRQEQIKTMERLLAVATTPYQRIRVYLTLISTRFDLTSGSTSTFMQPEQWKQ
jgi:translation initiation factor 3 subunit C